MNSSFNIKKIRSFKSPKSDPSTALNIAKRARFRNMIIKCIFFVSLLLMLVLFISNFPVQDALLSIKQSLGSPVDTVKVYLFGNILIFLSFFFVFFSLLSKNSSVSSIAFQSILLAFAVGLSVTNARENETYVPKVLGFSCKSFHNYGGKNIFEIEFLSEDVAKIKNANLFVDIKDDRLARVTSKYVFLRENSMVSSDCALVKGN